MPFGLIRYGVAPDHQSTKAVARVFDRVLSRDQRQLLRQCRGWPRRPSRGVDARSTMQWCWRPGQPATAGSEFREKICPASWAQAHSSAGTTAIRMRSRLLPAMSGSAVIIGNGNVAIDVARILAKGPEESAGSDLARANFWRGSRRNRWRRFISSAAAARPKPSSTTTNLPSLVHCNERAQSLAIRQALPEIQRRSQNAARFAAEYSARYAGHH